MKPQVILRMALDPGQTERLIQLQQMFAQACNHLSPLVQQTRCWNRVALHHMAYRTLRESFPALGSQMACNAIYSVSRTCRALFQNRESPYALHKLGASPLPRLLFLPQSPVYFDRHTLSLKNGQVSMYTLDGRIKFNLPLDAAQEALFRNARLREIVMSGQGTELSLSFQFDAGQPPVTNPGDVDADDDDNKAIEMPHYVMVIEDPRPAHMARPEARDQTKRSIQ